MKKLLKKTLALAFAATLVLGAGPLAGLCGLELPSISSFIVSAVEEEPGWTVATKDMIKYDGNTITGYTSELSGNIEIPTHIDGTAITTIKASAFENCSALTAVKIPEGITTIKPQAFKNCSNLEKVYFNSNSCEIANAIFNDCVKFSKIVFGENVTAIPENICSQATELTTAVFEGKVTIIEDLAFNNCQSLTGVDLSNATLIGRCAFNNCDSLKTVNFANNLKEIGAEAYRNCDGITSITIPESVTMIRAQAFENCTNLENVYFNSNNPEIINAIFKDCVKFSKIVFSENVTAIPENVCSQATELTTAVFEGKVTTIGDLAFNNCQSLTGVDLSNVTLIGRCAFNNCDSIKTVNFANNLKEIGAEAYRNCDGITSITIPESVTMIRAQAFENCANLENVYFNSNNPEIINAIFKDCVKFSKIVFGENVVVIPETVCFNAANLKTVEFDGLVTAIGVNAFYNCSSLTDAYYNEGSEEDWNKVEIKSGNDILSSDDVTIHFGVYPVTKTNEEFGVTVSYINKAFNEEVELSVTETVGEREKGSIAISDREISEQIGCFNIKMILADGSSTATVQPNGVVTVKMAIPANYIGKTNFKIVHHSAPRENFSTNPKGDEKKLTVSSDGKYWIFEVTNFSDFEFFAVEAAPSVSIKNNTGSKTISYGETLRLTANTSNIPADAKIFWYVDGVKKGEGTTFEASPESGSVEVTVKVVDAKGNDYAGADISDTEKITVKSGFFQKLISFFKNLFGISRIVTQAFMVK